MPLCASKSGQPLCTGLGQLLQRDPSGTMGNQTELNWGGYLPLHRQLLSSHPGDQRLVLSPRGGPGQDQAPEGGCAVAEAEQRCVSPLGCPRECWQGLEKKSTSCPSLCWHGAAPSPMAPMPPRALLSPVVLSGHRDPKRLVWGRSWLVQQALHRHRALPLNPCSYLPVAVRGSVRTPTLQPRLSLLLGLSSC